MSSPQSTPALPRVFIGSTKEALKVATLIQKQLFYRADGSVWTDSGIFEVGELPLESLERTLDDFPFGIFVMSPDDTVISRDDESKAPRDNLVFELGLWAGRYGRRSAFMVVPFGEKVRLPSDLKGVNTAEYKIRKGADGTPVYDVSVAANDIISVIEAMHKKKVDQARAAGNLNFWNVLSDSIVIVYGVQHTDAKHPRISLRDLDTATDILRFLTRWYPNKHTLFIRAETPGWERSLREDTDIILVGGPLTNSEFARHQSDYERHYHLRTGRLCEIKGQGVYHAVLGEGSGNPIPSRGDPQAIEDFPSDYVRRDYGLVTSRNITVYSYSRRVITISGIKGNGTRGASMALLVDTRQPVKLDDILPPLTSSDALEMVVATDVTNGIIDRNEVIELTLNGERKYISNKQHWEPCELEQACECRRLSTEG